MAIFLSKIKGLWIFTEKHFVTNLLLTEIKLFNPQKRKIAKIYL